MNGMKDYKMIEQYYEDQSEQQEQIEEKITAEEAYYEYLRDENLDKKFISWRSDGTTYMQQKG